MTVTVYSTHTCPFCKMEKEWLAAKGVAFTDVFVDDDPAAAEAMITKTGQMSVPVTVVAREGKEDVVVGFDQKRLAALLGVA